MTAITFPNNPPPYNGQTIIAENGTVYIYNDGRWTGQIIASAISNQLVNNGNIFTLDSNGNLHLPHGATISDNGEAVYITPNQFHTTYALEITSPSFPTPDDIHIQSSDPSIGVTLGNSFEGSYVTVNGTSGSNTIELVTYDNSNESSNTWTFGSDGSTVFPNNVIDSKLDQIGIQSNDSAFIKYVDPAVDSTNTLAKVSDTGFTVNVAITSEGILTHTWLFDTDGNLNVPGFVVSTDILGLTATNRVDITSSPLNLASYTTSGMNSVSAGALPSDLLYNSTTREIMVWADDAWRRVVRTTFNEDIVLTDNGHFRNSQGVRAAYTTEIPRDISELTDTTGLLGSGTGEPLDVDMSIDGGGAYATYGSTTLRADGGGSATRFGPGSSVFDGVGAGGGNYSMNLNGGGA